MAATVGVDESASFESGTLVERYIRARLVLEARRDPDRFRVAAEELYQFFSHLMSNELFWQVVQRVADDPPGPLAALFPSRNEFDDFEATEERVLVQIGVDEAVAADVAIQLSSAMARHDSAMHIDVETIRAGLENMMRTCDAARVQAQPERGHGLRRKLIRALRGAGAVLGVAADIAVWTPWSLVSIFGGIVELEALLSETVND